MFKLQSPIPSKYFSTNQECLLTQFFGENATSFYAQMGLKGHNGIDFKTKFIFRWIRNWFDAIERNSEIERLGVIPILAAHDGFLTKGYNNNQSKGIYMKVLSDETTIDGKKCKVETVYFHLSKVRVWRDDARKTAQEVLHGSNFVKAGSIIGWGGNSGQFTTGAHLHFGMTILWKQKGGGFKANTKNGYYGSVDPMLFLKDNVVYKKGWYSTKQYKNGKLLNNITEKV